MIQADDRYKKSNNSWVRNGSDELLWSIVNDNLQALKNQSRNY
jgi:hypothetical protein